VQDPARGSKSSQGVRAVAEVPCAVCFDGKFRSVPAKSAYFRWFSFIEKTLSPAHKPMYFAEELSWVVGAHEKTRFFDHAPV
jgi:hypothetical protein